VVKSGVISSEATHAIRRDAGRLATNHRKAPLAILGSRAALYFSAQYVRSLWTWRTLSAHLTHTCAFLPFGIVTSRQLINLSAPSYALQTSHLSYDFGLYGPAFM
jgi:hypothetical protein